MAKVPYLEWVKLMNEYVMDIQRRTKGRKISAMWAEFGMLPGCYCGNCCHLIERRHQRKYYKCEIYGQSASSATDWVKGWTACKAYNVVGITKTDLYKSLWHPFKKHEDDPPIEGQMEMEL